MLINICWTSTRNSIQIFGYSFQYFQICWFFYDVCQSVPNFWRINFKIFWSTSNFIPLGHIKDRFVFISRKSMKTFYFKYTFQYLEFLTLELSFFPYHFVTLWFCYHRKGTEDPFWVSVYFQIWCYSKFTQEGKN